MAKFDFNSSRYARFFKSPDNLQFLQTYVNDIADFRTNFGFWKQNFIKDPQMTVKQADGSSPFTVKSVITQSKPMMDMRAPLGGSNERDTEGLSFYSGTIPDFILSVSRETASERNYKEMMYAAFGNDADIINQWSISVQSGIDSADSTLSNMAAQLLSTGKIIWNYGRGIHSPVQKAEIPAANFVNAGEKVFTDPDCDILAQMVQKEIDFRDSTGFGGAMKWQVPYDMFHNIILKNAAVKAWIKDYRYHMDLAWTDTTQVTEETFRQAIVNYPGLSPIEIVVEKQYELNHSGTAAVHGWDEKIAVLRPQGFAGNIKYTSLLDQQLFNAYGSSTVSKQFAQLQGGIYTIVNREGNNGDLKEWSTDIMMAAVPALSEFPYHLILDTTVADA